MNDCPHRRRTSILLPRRTIHPIKKNLKTPPTLTRTNSLAVAKLAAKLVGKSRYQRKLKERPKSMRRHQKNESMKLFAKCLQHRKDNIKDQTHHIQQLRRFETIRTASGLPTPTIDKPLSRVGKASVPRGESTTRDDYILKQIKPRTRKQPPPPPKGLSLLQQSKLGEHGNRNPTSSNTPLSWNPPSFMSKQQFQSMPMYLRKGSRIHQPKNKEDQQQQFNDNWEERTRTQHFDVHIKKKALSKLDMIQKYGPAVSFDRTRNNEISKIHLELKLLRMNSDGTQGTEEENMLLPVQSVEAYRTAPGYIKKTMHQQRQSLDVLLNQNRIDLINMELGVVASTTDEKNRFHQNKLMKKVGDTMQELRKRQIYNKQQHLNEMKRKAMIYVRDPAEFYKYK